MSKVAKADILENAIAKKRKKCIKTPRAVASFRGGNLDWISKKQLLLNEVNWSAFQQYLRDEDYKVKAEIIYKIKTYNNDFEEIICEENAEAAKELFGELE